MTHPALDTKGLAARPWVDLCAGPQIKIQATQGSNDLSVDTATKAMAGCVKGAAADWRRALFVKALSPVETLLFGRGGGTEWKFEWSGGSFGIQLKAATTSSPARPTPTRLRASRWTRTASATLEINWGKIKLK